MELLKQLLSSLAIIAAILISTRHIPRVWQFVVAAVLFVLGVLVLR